MRRTAPGIIAAVILVGSIASVGAEDGERPPAASHVRGTIVESFGTVPESVEGAGADRLVMLAERQVEWTDERLPSRVLVRTLMDTREGWHPEGTVWPSISTHAYRLDDAVGAWVGTGHGFGASPEEMPTESFGVMEAELIMLSGEGAYEGLSAVLLLTMDATDWMAGDHVLEGYIYDGPPPPLPPPLEPGFSLPE
jgi:hypothetical protein